MLGITHRATVSSTELALSASLTALVHEPDEKQ